jgi:flagellar hook-associated protein 2
MAVSATTTTVLDVPTLVSQLMSLERQPITKLQTKVTDTESRISSFGTIKGLVSTLQSALTKVSTSLGGYTATSSDANVFSTSASSSAIAGSYTLSITSLARAQTLVATGRLSSTSAITGGSESTLSINVGGTATAITIPANATLNDIRSAINSANIGVSATIINDGSGTPYRLALTSSKSGTANAITSISSGDSALNALVGYGGGSSGLTEVAATNAQFTVNGIPITSATNTVTDAIQGVTLNLKNTATSATLTVERDTSGMKDAVSSFVEGYNALVSQLKSRSAYSSSSSSTSKQILAGDGTLRLMLEQLRGILSTPATGGTRSYLAEVGVSVQADSSLKLDSSKLESAMTSNFADVQNLFNSASGFITRLSTWGASAVDTGGLIDTRVHTLNDSIDNYNDQIDKLELRMKVIQAQYTATYTKLNTFLGTMNALSSYLTSQFSSTSNTSS